MIISLFALTTLCYKYFYVTTQKWPKSSVEEKKVKSTAITQLRQNLLHIMDNFQTAIKNNDVKNAEIYALQWHRTIKETRNSLKQVAPSLFQRLRLVFSRYSKSAMLALLDKLDQSIPQQPSCYPINWVMIGQSIQQNDLKGIQQSAQALNHCDEGIRKNILKQISKSLLNDIDHLSLSKEQKRHIDCLELERLIVHNPSPPLEIIQLHRKLRVVLMMYSGMEVDRAWPDVIRRYEAPSKPWYTEFLFWKKEKLNLNQSMDELVKGMKKQ